MKLTLNSTARRRTAIAISRSFGGPQIPSPVRRMAPKPRRLTVSSPPSSIVPAVAADRLVAFLMLTFTVHSPSVHLFRGAPTGSARFDRWGDSRRVSPEVFSVNNVMSGDYERLDPRRPVFRGISNQSHTALLMVSAGHGAISPGRRISIRKSKVVSVERRGATAVGIGCISGCEALGELGNWVVANWLCALVLLCDRKLLADLNRCSLILSNSPEQNFLSQVYSICALSVGQVNSVA